MLLVVCHCLDKGIKMSKEISGYENLYSITEDGEVYSHRYNKTITGDINTAGYKRVILCKDKKRKRFFVHRLVAMSYHGTPSGNMVVNHKDSNKLNNAPDNLEWCTHSENSKHSWKSGTQKITKNFIQEQNRKIIEEEVEKLVKKYKNKELNVNEEAVRYNVKTGAIYQAIYRHLEKHEG